MPCNKNGGYTFDPNSTSCTPGIAILAGGTKSGTTTEWLESEKVEVYGINGLRKQLNDLPATREGASVDYIDGKLYLCGGGTWDKTAVLKSCLRGEYDSTTQSKPD